MHQLGLRIVVVFPDKVIPLIGNLTDLVVFQPLEAMQERSTGLLDQFLGQYPVGRMPAVPENDGTPILSWIVHVIRFQRRAEVLARVAGLVVVLDDHHRFGFVAKIKQLHQIGATHHVPIHKRRPSLIPLKVGDKIAGVDKGVSPVLLPVDA